MQRMFDPVLWVDDPRIKTWSDYECPICGGIERVSSFTDLPVTHRHRFGADALQTGVVFLVPIGLENK